MLGRWRKRAIVPELAGKLRMAAAVAGEQILEEHVRSAVELVEEGAGRAPVERLLSAYARLHFLSDADARKLRERVLATLGRERVQSIGDLDGPRSLVARTRQRVRGRVNPELRDWVERHTARVELTVVDIHVDHALGFLRILGEEVSVQDGIDRYVDMMGIRAAIAEIVRLKVLKVLHDKAAGHAEPLRPKGPASYPLRVADHGV